MAGTGRPSPRLGKGDLGTGECVHGTGSGFVFPRTTGVVGGEMPEPVVACHVGKSVHRKAQEGLAEK